MITNNEAQEGIIDWLKANTSVLALSDNYPTEIREDYWSGEKFTYPSIRVSCEITPVQNNCAGPDRCDMIISCFSEQKSSKESQAHAGTIANELHNKEFTQGSIRYSAIKVSKTPRAIQDGGIWQADVVVNMSVK